MKSTIKATTASSKVQGVDHRGKEGHAWMMIPGSAGKMAQTDDELH